MNKIIKILIHVIIPMIIGGFIYIIFRSDNLLMFSWFESLGLKNSIDSLRSYFSTYRLPYWLVYGYPDGVWIYSFVSLMLIIWDGIKSNIKFFWIGIAPILGISAELGQYINIVPGTYENLDLFFCLAGSLLPFFLIKVNLKNNQSSDVHS